MDFYTLCNPELLDKMIPAHRIVLQVEELFDEYIETCEEEYAEPELEKILGKAKSRFDIYQTYENEVKEPLHYFIARNGLTYMWALMVMATAAIAKRDKEPNQAEGI